MSFEGPFEPKPFCDGQSSVIPLQSPQELYKICPVGANLGAQVGSD